MHFTYEENPDSTELYQGDVLARTPELDSILRTVHPHFYEKEKNLYFMVLTQSCDLVKREAGGGCKAAYINIAPVRSVDTILAKEIEKVRLDIHADVPVLTDRSKTKLSEFLTRLYNNNESGYFFLDAADTELPEDCCALLALSIAIKAQEHYDVCLKAKRVQLAQAFQAKLGWLFAQMYSRVGTTDWPPGKLRDKIKGTLKDAGYWVPSDRVDYVAEEYTRRRTADQRAKLSAQDIRSLVQKAPSRKRKVIDRAGVVLQEGLAGREDGAQLGEILLKRLDSDNGLTSLLA